MAKNKYLQITFGDAIIHEFSKTPKEGYDEQEGGKGYRKQYMKGLYGQYKGTSIRDGKFGKQISIQMLDINGDTNYLNIPLFDNNNSIGVYAEGFLTYLPYLVPDQCYRIYAYSMEQQGTTYQKKGISIKFADLTQETVYDDEQYKVPRLTYSYFKKDQSYVEGMIPAVTWEDKFGKKTKNSTNKDMYLWNILHQYAKDESKKVPAPQAQQPAPPQVPQAPQAPAPQMAPNPGYPQTPPNQYPPQQQQAPQGLPPNGYPPQVPQAPQAPAPQIPAQPGFLPNQGNPGFPPPPPGAPNVPGQAPSPNYPPQGMPPSPGTNYADDDDDLPF